MEVDEHVQDGKTSEKPLNRKREPSVLDNFRKLTNSQEKVRIKSGVHLLKHLCESDSGEKGEDELKYALERLIRGLGSSNNCARTGFFTTLVALLSFEKVSIDEIFTCVAKVLHKGGANSKSENADVCFGQILVAGAIVRSNFYYRLSDEEKGRVLKLLFEAGNERSYLKLASFELLCNLLHKIDRNEFEKVVFPLIKDHLSKTWQEQDLDSLYLLLVVQEIFPDFFHEKFLRNIFGTPEIITNSTLCHLSSVLTTIPRAAALKHPIFDLIIKIIPQNNLAEEFFLELDHTLVRFNRNKYFVITQLLTGILENLNDSSIIPEILTKNYLLQTVSMYKSLVGKHKDKEFRVITQKLFETLVTALKRECVKERVKIGVLRRLLFYPGTFIFEKVTKSKVIQKVTSTLNAEGVKKLASIYRDVVLAQKDRIVDERTSDKWWNSDRIYASHLLVKLINHPSMSDNDWKVEQLIFLGQLGILKLEIGTELADSLKETFYSSLDLKLTKLSDLRFILSKVVLEFNNFTQNLDPEVLEVWNKTFEFILKLNDSTKKKKAVFHTLFLHLCLQLFNNPTLAAASLTELFSCYERTKSKTASEGPLWIEVITDLFLNLLSHNSHLLRRIVTFVFPHLCKYVNATAMYQILGVLDPKNESNPLSRDTGSDEEEECEDDEESSSEEELEDEEESVNDRLRLALHEALNDKSDVESVDLDDLDEEEGEKLNEKLGQAFKEFRPNLGRGKKQKKEDEILTHFRVRVLDLVEIYLNSVPSMLLSLEIMLPLLQLLEFCIKDEHQKPLSDRVKACLKTLTSLKKFSEVEDVTEEVLVNLLKSLIEKGSRSAILVQEMSDKLSECCIFIVVCSETLKKKKGVIGVLKESLESFFTRRDCIVPYIVFKNILQMNWVGVFKLTPIVLGFAFAKKVRPFRRNQCLELLKIVFRNQRVIGNHGKKFRKLDADVLNFLRDSVDFFREFNQNPLESNVKERYLGSLFELLHCVKTSSLGNDFEGWLMLGEAVRECRSQISFSRDSKLAFNRLCTCLNMSNVVEMKERTVKLNNVEEVGGSSNVKPTRKKKNKSHKSLKLKKESKALRLQSLSEGLNGKRKYVENGEDIESDEGKKAKLS